MQQFRVSGVSATLLSNMSPTFFIFFGYKTVMRWYQVRNGADAIRKDFVELWLVTNRLTLILKLLLPIEIITLTIKVITFLDAKDACFLKRRLGSGARGLRIYYLAGEWGEVQSGWGGCYVYVPHDEH